MELQELKSKLALNDKIKEVGKFEEVLGSNWDEDE